MINIYKYSWDQRIMLCICWKMSLAFQKSTFALSIISIKVVLLLCNTIQQICNTLFSVYVSHCNKRFNWKIALLSWAKKINRFTPYWGIYYNTGSVWFAIYNNILYELYLWNIPYKFSQLLDYNDILGVDAWSTYLNVKDIPWSNACRPMW